MRSASFRPGDPVRVEVNGVWIDGRYEGFAHNSGHVVRTEQTVVVIPEHEPRLRAR